MPPAPTSPIAESLQAIGVTVFERGWLSSNNVLIQGGGPSALVDSGYAAHAELTRSLVQQGLNGQPLQRLLNTHLHSDHCGGNALLQATYPGLETLIPPGHAQAVARWDADELTYAPTGQTCPRFVHQGLLMPGQTVQLGGHAWEVHGAKGHDPHSVILYQREAAVLISADALWNNGFGVVFPELEGQAAFDEVGETLDIIEALQPRTVIPGHGPVFQDVAAALGRARSRLAQFQSSPEQHQRYALKVLVKFKLLEWQRIGKAPLLQWSRQTPYVRNLMPASASAQEDAAWLEALLAELARSASLRVEGDQVINL
ncbi:MAG TPA: MBL fold metallo-hydrolase [Hydrogenophaga sp.]